MSDHRYYQLRDDMLILDRWVLGDPHGGSDWVDPGQFIDGRPVSISIPLTFDVLHPGKPLDFSTGMMCVPVVTRRAADVLTAVCGSQVQLIEVGVEGHAGPFFIANATRNADCVDEQRSRGVEIWKPEDGQPEKVGEYQSIFKLQIDPARAGGLDFFRVARWWIGLIVSERVKRAMEDENLLGPKFDPVT